jgi:nitrite reductase (NO-forming)
VETLIAAALILGFARKSTYIAAAVFSLMIWSTAEGFGGPYTPGATDVGTSIIYVIAFLGLLALNAYAGPSRYSVDRWLERRVSWWWMVAEVRRPDRSIS